MPSDFACWNDYDEQREDAPTNEEVGKSMPEMTITIRKTDEQYGWEVRCGDHYEDHLGADEALWCIAKLLVTDRKPTYLKTQEEHDKWNARYGPKPPLEYWQKQLAPVESSTQ